MSERRTSSWVAGAAVALLAVALAATPVGAAPHQDLPPTALLPPLPDEVDALAGGVSPVMWQACNGVGLAVGLIVVAGTLAGVPPEAGVPLNDAITTASGPVLLAFFELCQQIPLPEEPPDCDTDELIPLLPSLGRPFLPAALLANQLRALDTALQTGGPLDGALGDAADDLLACAAGRNPEPDPVSGPEPEPTASADAPGGSGGVPGGDAAPTRAPTTGRVTAPAPIVSGDAPPTGVALPVARPVSSDGGTGTGLAMVLLGLGVLAGLGWLHAGNPRRHRAAAGSGAP